MINKIEFSRFQEMYRQGNEGLVLLGTGGDLNEWITGVTDQLKQEGIAKPSFQITHAYQVNTTGGRTDLLLLFNWSEVDTGKLAIWRIRFGDCSWLSDYVVNYADQHGYPNYEEAWRDDA